MRVIFTGGGTAGHINPSLSVAGYLRRHCKEAKILYIGKKGGMEEDLVPKAGFEFVGVKTSGFTRSFSPKSIISNVNVVREMLIARHKVRRIISEFKPDVVFGTGGYVSAPVLDAASSMGIKTITHEQNAYPGVTTKYLAPKVDAVLLAVERAKEHLPKKCKTIVVGNPVRDEIIFADCDKARKKYGLKNEDFMILSYGGSLGANELNRAVLELIRWNVSNGKKIHQIHGAGKRNNQQFYDSLKELDIKGKNIDIREYIEDMSDCMAAADLIISRAGAVTLAEIPILSKPSILIPSPNVTENHQYHNAMVLGECGAAIVIEEKNLTPNKLVEVVEELQGDMKLLESMGDKANEFAITDANKRIFGIMQDLSKGERVR